MAAPSSDKILLGAAVLLALASAAGFGWVTFTHPSAASSPLPRVELATSPYEPTAPDAPAVRAETWAAPVAQSRGREWIYDAFTPPEIFYNARSRQFTVKPPSSLLDEDALEAFGLELVAVRPEPFRLQLIGYVGGEGTWRGTFQNAVTGEVFLGSAGRRVPSLGVTIKSLEVALQPIRVGEATTVRQRVASAVVLDERANREVTLTHRERAFTGTITAFVAVPGETATREVREGDSFKIGEASYRIEAVKTTPAAIEVTKEASSLSQPDRRVLLPRETETSDESEAATPPAAATASR
jgi:hypothetical protein